MSPIVARTGPTELVLQRPLVGEDRKSRFGVVRSVLDPKPTSRRSGDAQGEGVPQIRKFHGIDEQSSREF
jgi:hypothetical protein